MGWGEGGGFTAWNMCLYIYTYIYIYVYIIGWVDLLGVPAVSILVVCMPVLSCNQMEGVGGGGGCWFQWYVRWCLPSFLLWGKQQKKGCLINILGNVETGETSRESKLIEVRITIKHNLPKVSYMWEPLLTIARTKSCNT